MRGLFCKSWSFKLIARKHMHESRCGNWNAKWHTSSFTHLPLCMHKKRRRILTRNIVGATPMHEHLSSLFSIITARFIHTAWIHSTSNKCFRVYNCKYFTNSCRDVNKPCLNRSQDFCTFSVILILYQDRNLKKLLKL